jgi:DNA-binding NarL/FixJ family response regulator
MTKPRVLLADDHTLVLEGIAKLLESEVDLLKTVEDGRALIEAARELRPDVVLLDISMPRLNGVEAARRLRRLLPEAKLIFLTMHGDVNYVSEALRVGAAGYVLKRSAVTELIYAIHQVMSGKTYVTPLAQYPEGTARRDRRVLTPRQAEVVQLATEGRTGKEIASILNISTKTVEFHKHLAMTKLGLNNTADLTRYAVRHRLTEA